MRRLDSLLAGERWEESIRAYSSLLSLQPIDPARHVALGKVYDRVGQWDDAKGQFSLAVALDPAIVGTIAITNQARRLEFLEEIAIRNIGTAESSNTIVDLLLAEGEVARAVEVLRRLLPRGSSAAAPPYVYFNLTQTFKRHGHIGIIVAEWEMVLEEGGDSVAGLVGLADACRRGGPGFIQRGIEAARRATSLEPGHYEANRQLGLLLSSVGELEGALAAMERAILARPDRHINQYLRFVSGHRDNGTLPDAIATLVGIVTEHQRVPEAWLALAKAYRWHGSHHLATQAAEMALGLAKSAAMSQMAQAELDLAQGQ